MTQILPNDVRPLENVAKLGIMDSTKQLQNSDVNWDDFDPETYLQDNYAHLLEVDQQIMVRVRDFFASTGVTGSRAVDVGAGTNLYPALGMLPFADSITLYEYGKLNVDWLLNEIAAYGPNWDAFWNVYTQGDWGPSYSAVTAPQVELRQKTSIVHGSVFDLPEESFDLGTMFFVACSISSDMNEFYGVLDAFMGSLTHKAPFALGFMAGSEGYPVGDTMFPAVPIDEEIVRNYLSAWAYDDFSIDVIEADHFRDGYKNMIVATGRVHKRK